MSLLVTKTDRHPNSEKFSLNDWLIDNSITIVLTVIILCVFGLACSFLYMYTQERDWQSYMVAHKCIRVDTQFLHQEPISVQVGKLTLFSYPTSYVDRNQYQCKD